MEICIDTGCAKRPCRTSTCFKLSRSIHVSEVHGVDDGENERCNNVVAEHRDCTQLTAVVDVYTELSCSAQVGFENGRVIGRA